MKVCLVIPCYNEFERFKTEEYYNFLMNQSNNFSLLFVNDGSTDKTVLKLDDLQSQFPNNVSILDLIANVGKAEAVRQGILSCRQDNKFDYIGYFDADLATPLEEANSMLLLLEQNKKLILVLASRIKRLGTNIIRKRKRHLLGRVFATFTSLILNLPVYDTQCGAKLFKSEIVDFAFKKPFLSKWLFDVEIIARIRNKYPNDIEAILHEYPVQKWEDVAGSKIKLTHMLQVPFQLLKIHRTYNKNLIDT
jgi:dolichyl-phosphate beta-glucosyltransferase